MNKIRYKKPIYPVNPTLERYLERHARQYQLPLEYSDLLRYSEEVPLLDSDGNPTLWNSVIYGPFESDELNAKLIQIYQILVADGSHINYLKVDRVDFCVYGNSQPFRVKILNQLNDNYDYYYIKKADSSRIYGLELEHLISPNKINFIYHKQTLVEEHTVGVPGDDFIDRLETFSEDHNLVRLSKEFVKFNERCFVQLLGDMRAYNFVVVVNQDFDDQQYRIRSIDFDQHCYEGRHRIYLPQFYPENRAYVELTQANMSLETASQYLIEEQSLLRKRYTLEENQINELIQLQRQDSISTEANVKKLRSELATYHNDIGFKQCRNMGDILERHILSRLSLL